METRDQKYARDAFTRVTAIKGQKAEASRYGVMAHKLPMLIHTSGLIQALTFVDARHQEGSGPSRLIEDLSKTILGEDSTRERLLREARGEGSSNLKAYIYLSRQVLAALLWYKRYAQSILGVEAGQDEDIKGDSHVSNQ
jgi:CRISPR-associated protein Cmr5